MGEKELILLTMADKGIIFKYGRYFMENITESLQNINNTLQTHNEIAQKMLNSMEKPENRFVRILQVMGLGAGALAIFNIIENIVKWILGGS